MVDFTSNTKTISYENTVVLNNQVTFKLSDTEIKKVFDILNGMVSSRDSVSPTESVASPVGVVNTKASHSSKGFWDIDDYTNRGGKGFKFSAEVKEQTSTTGVKFYSISRKGGWLKQEKGISNAYIKAIKGIQTYTCSFTDKNGKVVEYSAFGFKTKDVADKHCKELGTFKVSLYMMQQYLNSKGATLPDKTLGAE